MQTANLNNEGLQIDTTFDSIVIKKVLIDIPGGKTLDVTGIEEDVLKAGRIIIEQTSTGDLKPLKLTSPTDYEALPAGHTYKGVLVATILKRRPFAAIMLAGDVNEVAVVNYGLPAIPTALKNALRNILFTKD